MPDKLGIGANFPRMTLGLTDGTSLALPQSAKYQVVLFYRGHW